jgi:hypothetical protein
MIKLELPDRLVEGVAEAKRITNFEGKRRQMQFVGKLMRKLDPAKWDRYAQNRGIDSKEYGYMLRGALIGYTAFPKTFTDALYTNTDIYIPMDEYLTAIHKQVETQHPCD